jgi:hypothetical protein
MNLLVRYINQGRLDSDRPHPSPQRAAWMLLTRPDRLTGGQAETRSRLEGACPAMTALTSLISSFAQMLAPPAKTRPAPAAGHQCPRGRPARPALLHEGPGAGHPGRHRGAHTAVSQRADGGSQHQDQDDPKTDVRTRRLHPAPPPDPAWLGLRAVTTESAPEPLTTQARRDGGGVRPFRRPPLSAPRMNGTWRPGCHDAFGRTEAVPRSARPTSDHTHMGCS